MRRKYIEFSNMPEILYGYNALEEIGKKLKKLNSKTPMILASRTVARSGLIEKITAGFTEKMRVGCLETEIPADSDLEVIKTLAKKYTENGCDSIISIGGGSVIDTAKGVNIAVSLSCKNDDITTFSGNYIISQKLKPLIVIPTTSGSGSEVTEVAVIADKKLNKKLLFVSEFLAPDIAVLDPRVTVSLPELLTSQTGMDALAHACEAIISNARNTISTNLALQAIKLISTNIVEAVKNPENQDARLNMALAATLAGVAFSNAMVGIVHSIGHTIGAISHISHGICMSILLPYGLKYNLKKRVNEIVLMADSLLNKEEIKGAKNNFELANMCINKIKNLNLELNRATDKKHPICFKDYKDNYGNYLREEMIEAIANEAINDGSILYNAESASKEDMVKIITAAYTGKDLI